LNRGEGLTIIMVTHNLDLVAGTDRVVRLMDGRVLESNASPRMAIRGLKIAE
jgi:ABC-type lipoprotein export system ATPase subunit